MAKLIAISTGDIHLSNWKQYNTEGQRLKVSAEYLAHIFRISHENNIPIYFTGDLFHTPDGLSNVEISYYFPLFQTLQRRYPNAKLLGITGNHDYVTDKEGNVSSYVQTLSSMFPDTIVCIDKDPIKWQGTLVCGIPYLKHNRGFDEKVKHYQSFKQDKVLLIHTNLYGAKDPSGYEVDEVPNIPRNLGKFFKGFNLVLSGHIHKHANLWKDKIYMVGAPYQQRSSDSGTTMGYIEIYDNYMVKFIPYKAPEFRYYKEGEEKGNTYDYWIPIPKTDNFKKEAVQVFKANQSKETLAKEYCKVKGIKSKRRVTLLAHILNKADEV